MLTKRIANLVREGHARPDEILAVTYTKNAAQEMRQRVEDELRGTNFPACGSRPFMSIATTFSGKTAGSSRWSTIRIFGSTCAGASAN